MVKRSLPRRPSSFSSRRAAALPGEIETTEIQPFPVGFCRSTEELLGGSDARSLWLRSIPRRPFRCVSILIKFRDPPGNGYPETILR